MKRLALSLVLMVIIITSGCIKQRLPKSKIINVVRADCKNKNITLVVANLGTDRIERGELNVNINNEDKTSEFLDLTPLNPNERKEYRYDPRTTIYNGTVTIKVTAPHNFHIVTTWC